MTELNTLLRALRQRGKPPVMDLAKGLKREGCWAIDTRACLVLVNMEQQARRAGKKKPGNARGSRLLKLRGNEASADH